MQSRVSGPRLFARYAFPCAEGKLLAGSITREDFDALQGYVRGEIRPNKSLLGKCFPNAAGEMKLFCAARNKKEDLWSSRIVSKFWRYHHGHEGDCAVRQGFVSSFSSPMKIEISPENGGKMFSAINLYELPLEVGDKVFVHQGVVADFE